MSSAAASSAYLLFFYWYFARAALFASCLDAIVLTPRVIEQPEYEFKQI